MMIPDFNIMDLDNFKTIIKNFSVKDGILYWYDKAIVSNDTLEDIPPGSNYFRGGPTIRVEDGGTGVSSITGIVKGNGVFPFSSAIEGEDYSTNKTLERLKNKTIDARKDHEDKNSIINIGFDNFLAGLISDDNMLAENSSLKLSTQAAVKNYVDFSIARQTIGMAVKTPVEAASTENVDLDTFRDFSVIDGVILRKGERFLLKDQKIPSMNGIYVVEEFSNPKRTTDGNTGAKLVKASVYVKKGLTNKGSTWLCDNKSIIEWNTSINWILMNQFPVYQPGFGVLIEEGNTDIISLDVDKILHKNMEKGIEIIYGGTGKQSFIPNSVITSGDGITAFEEIPPVIANKILISTGKNSNPKWSTLVYPESSPDKALFFTDNNVVQLVKTERGIIQVDSDKRLVFSPNLPEDITIGTGNNYIYRKNGERVRVLDGGTNLGSISKDHMLFGYSEDVYRETPITAFGRQLVSLSKIDDVKILLNMGPSASLPVGDGPNTIASGDHTHDSFYVKKDGTTPFTGPVSGVTPVIPDHLTTKSYVDSISAGQLWIEPVLRIITKIPDELYIGDRFLVTNGIILSSDPDLVDNVRYIIYNGKTIEYNGSDLVINTETLEESMHDFVEGSIDPSLIPYRNYIIEVLDDGTLNYIPPSIYYVCKDLSTGLGYIYNGTEWILYSTNNPHNSLAGIQGGSDTGYFHMSEKLFRELSGYEVSNSHKHLHNYSLGLQGGDGIDYYHLNATEYAQISSINFKYHNRLNGVQGGNTAREEYYHLNYDQHQGLISGIETDLHTHDHNKLRSIQGSLEGFHLSEYTFRELTVGRSTNIHKHDHNQLANSQGGAENEYYHINEEDYEYVINLRNIIKTRHNEMEGKQGGSDLLDQFIHLDYNEYFDLTQGVYSYLHTHEQYINKDGTVSFERPTEAPLPEKETHIATKGYVDSLITGLKWQKQVVSKTYARPPLYLFEVSVGDRFIVAVPGLDEWLNLENHIVEWNGISWDVKPLEVNMAAYVLDTNSQWTWNGTEWIIFTTKQDHASLMNLYGGGEDGYHYHLSTEQYNSLTSSGDCKIHYHIDAFDHAKGPLSVLKGGTGLISVAENSFLYARKPNEYEAAPITVYSKQILNSASASEFRRNLELKNMALQDRNSVNITGGSITGIEALSPLYGGTGIDFIDPNRIIYTSDTNVFKTSPISEYGRQILNTTKEDLQINLGVNEPKDIQHEVNNGRSKLFYMLALAY